MDGWNTSFLLGWHIFRCYVSFREGKCPEHFFFRHFFAYPQELPLKAWSTHVDTKKKSRAFGLQICLKRFQNLTALEKLWDFQGILQKTLQVSEVVSHLPRYAQICKIENCTLHNSEVTSSHTIQMPGSKSRKRWLRRTRENPLWIDLIGPQSACYMLKVSSRNQKKMLMEADAAEHRHKPKYEFIRLCRKILLVPLCTGSFGLRRLSILKWSSRRHQCRSFPGEYHGRRARKQSPTQTAMKMEDAPHIFVFVCIYLYNI